MLVSFAQQLSNGGVVSKMSSTSSHDTAGATAPRHVPPHVELLIAFTNSEDHELNTDDLTTRPQFTQWLFDHGLLDRRVAASDDDLALARQLRAGLQHAVVANHRGASDNHAVEAAGIHRPMRLCGSTGQTWLRPVLDVIRGGISRVLI